MYEEAIILGLGIVSFLFAYLGKQMNEDNAGIVKMLFFSASAINGIVLINLCIMIADNNAATTISNMISETSYMVFLYSLGAAGLWLLMNFLIWVIKQLLVITGRVKEPSG